MGLWSKTKQIITKAVPVGIAPDWLTNKPFWSTWNSEVAVREGYKSVAWVYAAVKLRANAVASVPLIVETNQGGDWEHAPNHPLQLLLDNPNDDLDRNEMMRLLVSHLDLSGNGYWLKTRSGSGMPIELWPLLPQHVQVMPGRERLIAAYQYNQNGVQTIPGDEVMHCAYTNPDSLYFGMSPLEACGKGVDIDNAAASWQKIAMQNRGVPDGIFSFDADMTYDQWQEAREQVREQYTGIGSSRAPWVLSKAKYQQLSLSPVEMDYMETRKFSMQQICAVYGVPSEMLTGLGDANRASSETVRKTFWLDTIVPLLSEIESALNLGLARDFGPARQIRVRFDTSNISALQENYAEKINNAKNLWSMGVPFNVVSHHLELGFDEIEGGNVGYIPSNVIPASFDVLPDLGDPTEAGAEAYGNTNVQQQAFNGAQVGALQEIVQNVADGLLPAASARSIILAAFPSLTEQEVDAMVNPAEGFTPEPRAANVE